MADWVYRAEYSLSDRSSCKKCSGSIGKNVVRICILQQSRFHDGKDTLWHHARCFFQRKPNVKVDEIWHFHDLRWTDQLRLRKLAEGKSAEKIEDEDEVDEYVDVKGKSKRGKKDDSNGVKKKKNPENDPTEAMRAQNDKIWNCRDQLASLPTKVWKTILEANDQPVPVAGKILDRLTDVLVFGATEKCTVCASQSAHIVISADAYHCIGSVSEWAKCDFKTQTPVRKAPVLPDHLLEQYPFLEQYTKYQPQERLFPLCFEMAKDVLGNKNGHKAAATGNPIGDSVPDGPSTSTTSKSKKKVVKFIAKFPLKGLKISAAGTLSVKRADMTKTILALGGHFVSRVSKDTFVLVSDAKTISSRLVTLEMAEACSLHVVPVDFISQCQEGRLKSQKALIDLVERVKINPWPATAESLLEKMRPPEEATGNMASGLSSSEQHKISEQKKNSRLVTSCEARGKIMVKNGGVVDPDSELDERNHSVHREDGLLYACVLAKSNVADGTNGFYKMQIIRKDHCQIYFLFRSWGRIGTIIGGTKCDEMEKEEAIETFEFQFLDKTGNEWKNRQQFTKKPGKYFVMELDYGPEETDVEYSVAPGSKTKLRKPIQDLMWMIFDVEQMKKTMKMFEIDVRKMPLGKLSRQQILGAMTVLGELQEMIQAGQRHNSPHIIGASNRFFTLIPHDFGVQMPPILNEINLVKEKLEMLENLMEMEVAFSILRGADRKSDEDPLDQHYEKLNCHMEVVEKATPHYEQISQYVKNTHAATHTAYNLQVVDIFCLKRQGEADRCEKFHRINNHKLLWHGSRTTNYAGILSQGLRIAPPEAPVTGYMFGKGVYFADMVTKSANYCFTDRSNPLGLLLLSEVALGNMMELTEAKSITRLPPKYHSVKGCGQTHPDPNEAVRTADGLEIPLGHSKQTGLKQTSLLYNEYIVYDEAQISLRYLVKVKFNFTIE